MPLRTQTVFGSTDMGFVALSHEGKAGASNEVGLTLSGRMVTEMGKVNPLVESAGVE